MAIDETRVLPDRLCERLFHANKINTKFDVYNIDKNTSKQTEIIIFPWFLAKKNRITNKNWLILFENVGIKMFLTSMRLVRFTIG